MSLLTHGLIWGNARLAESTRSRREEDPVLLASNQNSYMLLAGQMFMMLKRSR